MLAQKVVGLAFWLHAFLRLALTASLPVHLFPPASTSSLSEQLNSTLPATLFTLNSSSNALPNDPILYEIPGSPILLNFHSYSYPLPTQLTYRTLQHAVADVLAHVSGDPTRGDIRMQPRFQGYEYGAGQVRLGLRPEPLMTWGMWGDALMGLRLFGQRWEFVALKFDVWDCGKGEGSQPKMVGNGELQVVLVE